MNWNDLANRVLAGDALDYGEALGVLESSDDDLLAVLHAAFRVRERYFGREVRVHVLRNAKSGSCPEDCSFCSQSTKFATGIDNYRLQSVDELVEGAREAYRLGAVKYCMVTATRGPSSRDLDVVCDAVRRIKAEIPIRICTSLGLLREGQAEQLAEAGVDRFNHNLEASRRFFPEVCSTHSFDDRVATVRAAKAAGMEACCGGIFGMGETNDDRAALAFELRELEVESIPVNFLDPRPGTPLGDVERMRAVDCLRVLAMFRFVNPTRDIRIAGGREANLGHLQPLALFPANSMFSQGYLTTPGQGHDADLRMIEDLGFHLAVLSEESAAGRF
jgi:biotin synthase